uniref:Integrase catalytic domain-containing protein n=1 Tax=Tanacetum cinerariifolium TaxID=118510 RepID=A0A6L2KSY0_TANCI|nr:hypothetical protein [Tanacetum cinerariifolium]
MGYLKFSANDTKREVFGMPIPGSLVTADIREASYYQEYLTDVTKHRRFLASETRSAQDSHAPKPAKPTRKPKPTAQKDRINILQYLIHLRMCKDFPTKMMKMFLLVENLRQQNPNNHEVAVCSSLRSHKSKRTIESRAKRSSKNNLSKTLFQYACFFTHCENKDGNPARANIKQALANELTNAFGKPFEVPNNVFEHWVFNSLVYSSRALFALRRSGLRTASTAAKPCQGDFSEFYLITGSIHTDQRGTVVLATLFNRSEQRHFRSRGSNLYTISMADMMKSSPICLLFKASKMKSWLWHCRLSYLNFNTIKKLVKQGLVKGLPKLKYTKDHLCSACQMGKSKKESHPHNPEPSTNEKLQMLYMDLCRPMQVASINKKSYILVIVDDYSRFTWVKFLRTKDEAPKNVIKFLKQAQVSLNATVRYLRTDNDTEFLNQTLQNYTEYVGITHTVSTTRTPQQNNVVERHNRTDRKPELKYLHVFDALCYPTNDFEDIGKLQPKAYIGIFISYLPSKKAFRIYNKRARQIMETMNVQFDELTKMAFEQHSLRTDLHVLTSGRISSGLVLNQAVSISAKPPTKND